ncbi:hypothetical protein Pla108_20750 [Botrimarina colliarenosi]|uniref:Uncharacterized protein n=1 Tax=Botrimarina colliarenosi TaxID=2528001 RepID=A0A5C6AFT7_9BACT|nr:hypothetical protein [Botrimarina colliarenosi]TWT97921.1 hypothetical protein Pla108_20750 [Botrimarina colliarenosi]
MLAIWLLLMIVCRQLGHIADASPATWLAGPFYLMSWGPFIVLGAIGIILTTCAGTLAVHDPQWWDWGTNWLSWLASRLGWLWPWRSRAASKSPA